MEPQGVICGTVRFGYNQFGCNKIKFTSKVQNTMLILLLWISFGFRSKVCLETEITVSEAYRKMCDCCKEEGKQDGGCYDEKIIEILKSGEKNACLNKLNSYVVEGPYRNVLIDYSVFVKWCKKIISDENSYEIDMFALSALNLQWNDDLKEIILSAVIDNKKDKLYDQNIQSIHAIIENGLANFFPKFYENITKEKEYITSCLTYVRKCYDVFSAYIDKKPYKGCSPDDVTDMINSIIRGLPTKDLVVKKLSPQAISNSNSGEVLLWYFCSIRKGLPTYKYLYYSMEQLKSFFYHTAKLNWPIRLSWGFLNTDVRSVSRYIPKGDPYKISKTTWNFEDLVKLVDKGCVFVNAKDLIISEINYPQRGIRNCIDYVVEVTNLSIDFYQFSFNEVYDLLMFNWFAMIHKDAINFLKREKIGYTRDAYDVHYAIKLVAEYKVPSDGTSKPIPFVTKEMLLKDERKLGVRAIINLFMLHEFLPITDINIGVMYEELKKIPISLNIEDKEKEFNKSLLMNCTEQNNNDPVCYFRKRFGYQPDYYEGFLENEKKWGKVVFTAIHATSFRFASNLITKDKYTEELIKCINDVLSSEQIPSYCSVFKGNPYFGEFDGVIQNYYKFDNLIIIIE